MRTKRELEKNREGEVINPLRENISTFLESERKRRGLNHQEMASLFRTQDGEGLAYGTYIGTVRKRINVTLRTVAQMSLALDVSIADLLMAGKQIEPWTRSLTEMDVMQRLAAIVEGQRNERGMTRRALAAYIGITEVTYTKIERAAGNVSVDTLAMIAKALGLDPVTFLFKQIRPAKA